MSMILPDSLVIKAALDHHHDGLRKAFIALGEGPGLQHQPLLAKSRFCFRTLLTRFLPLSRTNSQKQRTTHHIKFRTSAFPFLLCILYVLVLFCFQVFIFAMLSIVNDLFPWMIFPLTISIERNILVRTLSLQSRFGYTLSFPRYSTDTGFPIPPSPAFLNEKFRSSGIRQHFRNDRPIVLRLKISNPHKTTIRMFQTIRLLKNRRLSGPQDAC